MKSKLKGMSPVQYSPFLLVLTNEVICLTF
ncbi:hypothetical protein [Bacillus pseudomycoides]